MPLDEHLRATDRKIAHVIEMCVCCLLERGLNEEGLLRVGCGTLAPPKPPLAAHRFH